MTIEQVRLIRDKQQVSRGLLSSAQPADPHIAVVYWDGHGQTATYDGRAMRRSEQRWTRFRFRYDVDVADHRDTVVIEERLPSRDDKYHFVAEADVGFRVTDPEAVVRRNISDAMAVVVPYAITRARPIARRHDIRWAKEAEEQINTLFAAEVALPEGISIYHCVIRLSLDAAARSYLQKLDHLERVATVRDAEHQQSVIEVRRDQQLETMQVRGDQELGLIKLRGDQLLERQAGTMDGERRAARLAEAEHKGDLFLVAEAAKRRARQLEYEALKALAMDDIKSLIAVHLANRPDDTERAFGMLLRFREAVADRAAREDERVDGLARFLASNNVIKPADLEPIVRRALAPVRGMSDREPSAAGDGWEDPLPDGAEAAMGASTRAANGVHSGSSMADGFPGPTASDGDRQGPHDPGPVPDVIPGSTVSEPPSGAAPAAGRIAPVYLAIDESAASRIFLETLMSRLATLPEQLAEDADATDALRLTVLGYAHGVVVRSRMSRVRGGVLDLTLVGRSGCRLAPLFDDLRERITADVEDFRAQEQLVSQPTLVLLHAGRTDDATWPAAHARLTDRATFRHAPNIVACGVEAADPALLAGVATQAAQALVAVPELSPAAAADAFVDFITRLLAQISRMALTGPANVVLDRPEGFVSAVAPEAWDRASTGSAF